MKSIPPSLILLASIAAGLILQSEKPKHDAHPQKGLPKLALKDVQKIKDEVQNLIAKGLTPEKAQKELIRLALKHQQQLKDTASSLTPNEKEEITPPNLLSNPEVFFNYKIDQFLSTIPVLIDAAVEKSEADLKKTIVKGQTQGWSIITGSWKEVLGLYMANNRTWEDVLNDQEIWANYGFIYSYGLGFGLPLVLSTPEGTVTCNRKDFEKLIEDFELENGIQPLLDRGSNLAVLKSIVDEFSIVVPTKIRCLEPEKNLESLKVHNAVNNLVAAMKGRIQVAERVQN